MVYSRPEPGDFVNFWATRLAGVIPIYARNALDPRSTGGVGERVIIGLMYTAE